MFNISFLEKIKLIINLIFKNYYFIILFCMLLIFTILTILFKKNKLIFFISLLFIVLTLLFISYKDLYYFIDYFINTIFMVIYFPNFFVYVFIIFIENVIVIKSILNKKSNINIIFYYLIMYLFILSIYSIKISSTEINSKISIYTNKVLLSQIEITTLLFSIFLMLKLIIYIYKKIKSINKVKLKKIEVEPLVKKIIDIEIPSISNIDLKKYNEINKKIINLYKKSID